MRIVLTALLSFYCWLSRRLALRAYRLLSVADGGYVQHRQRRSCLYLTRVTDVLAEPPALEVTVTLVGWLMPVNVTL